MIYNLNHRNTSGHHLKKNCHRSKQTGRNRRMYVVFKKCYNPLSRKININKQATIATIIIIINSGSDVKKILTHQMYPLISSEYRRFLQLQWESLNQLMSSIQYHIFVWYFMFTKGFQYIILVISCQTLWGRYNRY